MVRTGLIIAISLFLGGANLMAQNDKADLQSYSKYDFVPGDSVLFYEDFSQESIGDFPAQWATNGSGEIKTVNAAEGKWLHMTTAGNQFQLMKVLDLPDDFILEFDVILSATEMNTPGIWMILYKAENSDPGMVVTNPLPQGVGLYIDPSTSNSWIGKAYHKDDWQEGASVLKPVKADKVEHVIVWVQKRRMRVYHDGAKVLDMPTLIPANFKPDRFCFDLSDCNDALPFVTNIRFATLKSATRNRLLK